MTFSHPKHDRRRIPMILLLLTSLAAIPWAAAAEDQRVTVQLSGGRVYTGQIDVRTDFAQLWLRRGTSTLTLIRPIAWDQIVRAVYGDQQVSVDQLRQLAEAQKLSASSARPYYEERSAAPDARPRQNDLRESSLTETDAQRAKALLDSSTRIRSVSFEASLANWDADVEADGLILSVYPITDGGRLAPVNATLHVNLTALRSRQSDKTRYGRGLVADQIADWTRRVSSDDFGRTGITFQLPFQQIHPEFNTSVAPNGLVHITLAVPGHGVFENSQDLVRIRPFAPLRDQLQRSGHDRFLPTETTGRR